MTGKPVGCHINMPTPTQPSISGLPQDGGLQTCNLAVRHLSADAAQNLGINT
jgi:hypothetical protein